jgi:hypothetical protein
VIGRSDAEVGFVVSDNTCEAASTAPAGKGTECLDFGPDHTYKIYLLKGELLTVSLATGAHCTDPGSWYSTLKIRWNTGCDAAGCSGDLSCQDGSAIPQIEATKDGWYFVIVDGQSSAFGGDMGEYTLNVLLLCNEPGCGC